MPEIKIVNNTGCHVIKVRITNDGDIGDNDFFAVPEQDTWGRNKPQVCFVYNPCTKETRFFFVVPGEIYNAGE
ncbi:hypothetical protein M405DRAFT_818573 [Rhizopogon salebrosus TDB-379]|nr:hypothetical protein M405DRAFT_818573 [Rhizopogon salebrosus TDB-379]